ncbi:hypothetical protein ACPVTF_17925 [Geobacillus icigianus]|uniref:hypothetical protein n=1 Tax=Geobacillus TaxID=129337 RepID=UPI000A5435C6|nr:MULTISPECIES: hypothetical protein [Geobacillus]
MTHATASQNRFSNRKTGCIIFFTRSIINQGKQRFFTNLLEGWGFKEADCLPTLFLK